MEQWERDIDLIMRTRCVRQPGDQRPIHPWTALEEITLIVRQEIENATAREAEKWKRRSALPYDKRKDCA